MSLTLFPSRGVELPENRVVIVGAGPTGLVTALELARQGVGSVILERNPGVSHVGSRGIALDQHTLETFERVGAGAIVDMSLKPEGRKTYLRDQCLFGATFPKPEDGALPLLGNLQQFHTERILLDAVAGYRDEISIAWSHTVLGVEHSMSGVRLRVDSSDGEKCITAPYVVACDGARSTVRDMCGLDFPGFTDQSSFIIVDVNASLDRGPIHQFTFCPTAGQGQTQLIVPQPGGVWRIDWQLYPNEDREARMQPDSIREYVRRSVGDVPFEIVWASCYRFHQRLMPKFTCGRVFFAGDAAHLVAPFGARGMNSGIRDAVNLSWKLARVVKDESPDALLSTYDIERVAAGLENQTVTRRSMAFISPPCQQTLAERDAILEASLTSEELRGKVDSGRISVPESYVCSPLNYNRHPLVGTRLRDLRLRDDSRLRHSTGSRVVVLASQDGCDAADHFISESDRVSLGLCPSDLVVVRPDGYVSAVCGFTELSSVISTIYGERL